MDVTGSTQYVEVILISSLLLADILSTYHALNLLKNNWTKLEKRIYVLTTAFKYVYAICCLFSAFIETFKGTNENVIKIYKITQYCLLPFAAAWGLSHFIFVTECVYFGTFPKEEEEE